MPTPFIQVESKQYTVTLPGNGSALEFKGTALDSAGAVINLSSGYTALLEIAGNPSQIQPTVSFVGNSDGTYVVSCTMAHSLALPTGSNKFAIVLSNDSLTTQSVAQTGTITATKF
jgi:hypothetical protein